MKRLTKDNYTDDVFEKQKELIQVDKHTRVNYSQANYNDDLWKAVKEKEDLEEQLGCPLEVVFKALKQQIYSTHPKTKKLCLIICPTFYFASNQWLIGCHSMEWNAEEMCCDSWDCFPKDYKKTWWLKENREE